MDLTLPNVRKSDVLKNLSVALSAFANSGGGVLIYGLKVPKDTPGRWEVDDGSVSVAVGVKDTREWLESVIPSLVDYPLTGFNVYAIYPKHAESQIHPGQALYVVEILDSPHAPHQAQDKVYYIRTGAQSKPVEHRHVLDMMGRRQHPQIEMEYAVKVTKLGPIRRVNLVVRARNVGRLYASYVTCLTYLPPLVAAHEYSPFGRHSAIIDGKNYYVPRRANTRRDVIEEDESGREKLGASYFDPILPSLERAWEWPLPNGFNVAALSQNDDQLHWKVHADNAPERSGSVKLSGIPVSQETETLRGFVKTAFGRAALGVILVVTAIWLILTILTWVV